MMRTDSQKGIFAFYRYVCSQLDEVNPMVIHIYGSWDWRLCLMAFAAYRHNKTVVYSPMRGLTSSNIEWNPFKKKFLFIVAEGSKRTYLTGGEFSAAH